MAESEATVTTIKANAEPTEAEIAAFAAALDEAIEAGRRAVRQAEINTASLRATRLENKRNTV